MTTVRVWDDDVLMVIIVICRCIIKPLSNAVNELNCTSSSADHVTLRSHYVTGHTDKDDVIR